MLASYIKEPAARVFGGVENYVELKVQGYHRPSGIGVYDGVSDVRLVIKQIKA